MNNKIVMLSRELLHPHPDNPRKDLGDLMELADSIAEHGIMQNLTVVPDEGDGDGYTILIGHRRFAASEGVLKELPCVVIKGLSQKEQLGIMLCENMQRSDLTYQEQAHGFQMMMDLGDTIETIAEKTGFSKQTIKHRLAIAELDPDAIKEVSEYFQLSITDYMELEKVDDLEERNAILKMVTSSKDLKEEVREYLEDQKRDKHLEYYKKLFLAAGWKEATEQWFYYGDGYRDTKTELDQIKLDEDVIPEKKVKEIIAKIKGDIVFGSSYRYLMVRKYNPSKKKSEDERKKEEKAKEAQLKKNKKALREIQAEMCDSYMDYFNTTHHDNQIEMSTLYCFLDLARDLSCTLDYLDEKVVYLASIVSNKGYEKPEDNPMSDYKCWTSLFQLLGNIYWCLASSYNGLSDYNGRPNKEILEAHKMFQTLMKEYLDYHPRKEWDDVLNGTSDLYTKEGKS